MYVILFIVHNNIVLSIKTNSYDTFHEIKIHNVKYDKEHKYLKGPISILEEKDSIVGKRRFLGTDEEEETPPSGASGGGTGETTGEQTCRSVQNTTSITSDIGKVEGDCLRDAKKDLYIAFYDKPFIKAKNIS